MKINKLFAGLFCLPLLALASCSGGNQGKTTSTPNTSGEPQHVHTYSDAWSRNNSEHWHQATCGHDVDKDRAPHTPNAVGICTVCGFYEGDPLTLNMNNGPTIEKGHPVYYRAERSGNDTDYGVYTDFNDIGGDSEHIQIDAYILVGGNPVHRKTIEDYETALVSINQTTDDNYIYLVYSYSGENASATVETSSLNTVLHGYDTNRNYYGVTNDDVKDGPLALTNDHLINGELCIAFNPNVDVEDYCYEIVVNGECDSWYVMQANLTTVTGLDQDIHGYFLPENAEPVVINIRQGSNITVQVTEHPRA